MKTLSAEEFGNHAEKGALIIDIRSPDLLKQGFVKGSIALASLEKFAEYLGFISRFDTSEGFAPILLVSEEEKTKAFADQANKMGVQVVGVLSGGVAAWESAGQKIDIVIDVEADELMMDIPYDDHLIVMDIRPAISFGNGHLKDSVNLPLTEMADPLRLAAIEESDNIYIVADSDEEAYLAATILKKQDIHNIRVVLGGWESVKEQSKAEVVKDPGMLN